MHVIGHFRDANSPVFLGSLLEKRDISHSSGRELYLPHFKNICEKNCNWFLLAQYNLFAIDNIKMKRLIPRDFFN